jgi:hypothetical protein
MWICPSPKIICKQIQYFCSSRSVHDTIAMFSNAVPLWAAEYGRIPTPRYLVLYQGQLSSVGHIQTSKSLIMRYRSSKSVYRGVLREKEINNYVRRKEICYIDLRQPIENVYSLHHQSASVYTAAGRAGLTQSISKAQSIANSLPLFLTVRGIKLRDRKC